MSEPSLLWIKKRDGRLQPFDPDQISRDLFAATQQLGSADAFLARELADGAVHFLASEAESGSITAAQITDTVAKVVRELGHAALSRTFLQLQTEGGKPAAAAGSAQSEAALSWDQVNRLVETAPSASDLAWQLSRSCLRACSLRDVFGPDLVAAQDQKLLTLGNLDAPFELSGLALSGADAAAETIAEARDLAGQFVALDSPDHALALSGGNPARFARELRAALRLAGLGVVVNLNCTQAPTWAGTMADGPLFAAQQRDPQGEHAAIVADRLVEELLSTDAIRSGTPRIDWHVGAADLRPEAAGRLQGLVRRALEGAAIAFVMDRPNRPVALAEGIDRRHPALLMTVGLHLPALAEQPAVRRNPALFLQKLGSLARMALSAGVQKREFLRKHAADRPGLSRGFLLERARLGAVPIGLGAAVQALLGQRIFDSQEALDFSLKVVEQLREALQRDGRSRHLEACLDGPCSATEPVIAGDPAAPAHEQLQTADALRDATGTAVISLLPGEPVAGVVDVLRHAWQKTALGRVRLSRPETPVS